MVRKRELEQVKDGTETGGAGELKCGSGREKWDIVLEVARRTFRRGAIPALLVRRWSRGCKGIFSCVAI